MSINEGAVAASEVLAEICSEELTFGSVLESVRLCDEKTQEAFAQELGISQILLRNIELGRCGVGPGQAARFAQILGYSITQFVRLALQDMADREGVALKVDVAVA